MEATIVILNVIGSIFIVGIVMSLLVGIFIYPLCRFLLWITDTKVEPDEHI